MRWPIFGGKRRTRRDHAAPSRQATGLESRHVLEALEPRVLLSAVGLGDLPDLNTTVDIGGDTIDILLPTTEYELSTNGVTGTVFRDGDGDGLWDPDEYALAGVTVFADVDGDGLHGSGEISGRTNQNGSFGLYGLPTGGYDVRVVMPKGYRAAGEGSDAATVAISPTTGIGGLTFGLARTGFDLGLVFGDVSMPDTFKTGTRVTLPVILTNRGDVALPAGGVKLRVWVSADGAVGGDDIRLAVVTSARRLAPGESMKLGIDVDLPDALADFTSYLIVDAVGRNLRADLDPGDNKAVSHERMVFEASSKPTTLTPPDLTIVLGNWSQGTPYGGYEPGDGFVGIEDLNTILSNWNGGTGTSTEITDIDFSGGGGGGTGDDFYPWLDEDNPGLPGSISGSVVHDPDDQLYWDLGWLLRDYDGLGGWTVYLDQNLNDTRDAGEPWTLTAVDGTYSFTDLPTNSAASVIPMLYYVEVDAPASWERHHLEGNGALVALNSGEEKIDINFGFYAAPRVGQVWVEGGYLADGLPTTVHAEDVIDLDGTIERVVFYYDHGGDGRADDILGIDTDGSDGYSVVTEGRPVRGLFGTPKVYAVAQDSNGHLGAATTDTAVVAAVDVVAGKDVVYRETDGTIVTFSLTGPGRARVQLYGTEVRAYDFGDVIELTGSTGVNGIQLTGTTGRSKLNITTSGKRGAGLKADIYGYLSGDTPLGMLYAPQVNFVGDIFVGGRGGVRNMKVGSVNNIRMAGARFGKGVKITAGKITGQVELGSPLRLLNAGMMSHVDLTAPSADRILVKKDYLGGRVALTDIDADLSLGLMAVGRRMRDVSVLAASSIDTVRAGLMIRSHVGAGAWTNRLAIAGQVPWHGVVRPGVIQHVEVGVFADSHVSAWRLGSIDLEGAKHDLYNRDFGLTYHRLVRYQGPEGVDQTVI